MDLPISRINHSGINWIHYCAREGTNSRIEQFKDKKIQLTYTHKYSEKKFTIIDVLEDVDTKLCSSVDFNNRFNLISLKLKEKGKLLLLDGDEVDMCRRQSKDAQGYINSIALVK